jgi:serine/threonine protein phosphatase 1
LKGRIVRYLAIGDIHGCFQALRTLEALLELKPDDVLITLGDYIDRGPDSSAVLDWLLHQSKQRKLIALRGNHEVMMLEARADKEAMRDWLANGGDTTLASYSHVGDAGQLVDVPDVHWTFLEYGTRPYFETETHFFVHANAYPDLHLKDQPEFMLYWEPLYQSRPHESGKTMICGHTAQKSGVPKNLGHAICIDTWVYGAGWLTALDVATGDYWQANQKGESRLGNLDLDCGD